MYMQSLLLLFQSTALSQSESVLAYIVIHQSLVRIRFSKHQIIAIPSNLPFCELQSILSF